MKNFEILIIDDGSEKINATFLDDLKDDRLRVEHVPNAGVSKARNIGISMASGTYLTFVDADDIISPTMLEEALLVIESEGADMIVGCIKKTENTGMLFSNSRDVIVNTYDVNKDCDLLLRSVFSSELISSCDEDGWTVIMQSPVAKVIKRTFLEEVYFPEGIAISEDTIWNYKLIAKKREKAKISVSNYKWYKYIQNADSVLHTYTEDLVLKINQAVSMLNVYVFQEEGHYSEDYIKWLIGKMQQIIDDYLLNELHMESLLKKSKYFLDVINNPAFSVIRNLPKKSSIRLKLKICLLKSGLAIYYYNLKKKIITVN